MGQQSLFNNCQDADSFHLCTWTTLLPNFYRPQTKFAKVMFLHVSVSHSVHRGGHAWLPGGMHGCQGACVVVGGCVVAGGHVWLHVGCAWLWGAWVVAGGACMGYDEIQSMSGLYASYWNAFLFPKVSSEKPS